MDSDKAVDETLRLRYRYLDLRRERMTQNIELRHEVVAAMRRYLDEQGFLEIETPFLTRSTPEGARDFLVPSRIQPGSFYALPQSPQLFKQLLMVSGFERYYQVVRCFRDEAARADRLPEFTQLDMELSFVDEEDVLSVCEGLVKDFLAVGGVEVDTPFERLGYDDAMLRYGSDRPDRRFGMEIHDLGSAFAASGFKVFSGALEGGGVVRGFRTDGSEDLTRKRLDELTDQAQQLGAKGLVWAVVEGDGWRSPVAKFLKTEEMSAAAAQLGAKEGDAILIVADSAEMAARVLGALRLELAPPDVEGTDVFWVLDFPMFEWNEEEKRWDALHHPFTAPTGRAAQGVRRDRPYGGGGGSALRLPARGVPLWRATARRHRVRRGPDHRPLGGDRFDPRGDRVPQGRERRGSPHGRSRAGGRGAASRARNRASQAASWPGLAAASFSRGPSLCASRLNV